MVSPKAPSQPKARPNADDGKKDEHRVERCASIGFAGSLLLVHISRATERKLPWIAPVTPSDAPDSDVISRRIRECADQVTVALDAFIPAADGPEANLMRAMRHAALAPRWRYRPFLVIESGRMFAASDRSLLRAATAIECVVGFSQSHEDLPILGGGPRSGPPPVHEIYDEATALLAGDALFALAFEILADRDTAPDSILRVQLVQRLAHAAGARGRAAGRMLQRHTRDHGSDTSLLARQHRMAITPLTVFAVEVGALLGGASEEHRQALIGFAQDISLARAIRAEIDSPEQNARSGFLAALGADEAKRRMEMLASQAKSHLFPLGARARDLIHSVDLVLQAPADGMSS